MGKSSLRNLLPLGKKTNISPLEDFPKIFLCQKSHKKETPLPRQRTKKFVTCDVSKFQSIQLSRISLNQFSISHISPHSIPENFLPKKLSVFFLGSHIFLLEFKILEICFYWKYDRISERWTQLGSLWAAFDSTILDPWEILFLRSSSTPWAFWNLPADKINYTDPSKTLGTFIRSPRYETKGLSAFSIRQKISFFFNGGNLRKFGNGRVFDHTPKFQKFFLPTISSDGCWLWMPGKNLEFPSENICQNLTLKKFEFSMKRKKNS